MIAFFAKHPTAANLLMLALLVAGILSLRKLRRETFPDFRKVEVEIRVPYPGATAEDVEEAICQRIEDAIDGVRYVEEVRSEARDGMGVVTVEMQEGGDYRNFKDEIDTEIASIDDFPEQAEEVVVTQLNTTDPVMALLVSGPMTPADLKLYAEGLKDRLQQLPNVSLVEIDGFSDHQLRVELRTEALLRYGLSAADVADVVRRQSVDLPAGVVEARDEEVLVRFAEERTTPEQLADLVLKADSAGSEIRIRDLGVVVDDFEKAEQKILLGSRRAALLRIQKTKSDDAMRVAATVYEFLDRERQLRPAVDIEVTQDVSRLVEDRLTMLVKNGWQGMCLVFLTMWFFFNLRLSFWVVVSLPVSFLGAFFLVPHFGLTINMLTMVGLLLAIGILMDDGIVIAENVAAHRARGKDPRASAIDGVREVSPGVLSAFLTTVCVLGPLAFLAGTIGRVLEVVPAILIMVLAVSLIEAFMILPAHLRHSLEHTREAGRLRRRIDGGFEAIRSRVFGPLIDFLISWRYLWIGCVLAMFFGSLALVAGGVLRFQVLPELDGDTVVARVLMPAGTPLERTEEVVAQLTESLDRVNRQLSPEQPDGEQLVRIVYVKFSENADAFEQGPHVATVYADLLEAEVRNTRVDDLLDLWREDAGVVRDALAITFTEPTIGPAGRNIEIRVSGHDLDQLREVSIDAKKWLQQFPGVLNLTEDLRPGRREYRVRFRPGVLAMELDSQRMAAQLRAAFQGQKAAEIQVGSESYEIEVRFDRAAQDSVSDLEQFQFVLPSGEFAPLASVAELEMGQGWSRIARVDSLRTVTLRGDVDAKRTNTDAILVAFQNEFIPETQLKHPNVQFRLEGEAAEGQITRNSMKRAMMIGLIGVFVLLSFQFRSYVEPLIVMVAIPLSLIGVIWGHLLLGLDLAMPSILGFISLAGIVVNDSILLVIFLKKARAEGRDVKAAAGQASRDRFRAILMTSLTTIAGLMPLMAEQSLQAQILIPLAVSVVFGLLSSTVLVLLVVPCLYVVLHDLGLTGKPSSNGTT